MAASTTAEKPRSGGLRQRTSATKLHNDPNRTTTRPVILRKGKGLMKGNENDETKEKPDKPSASSARPDKPEYYYPGYTLRQSSVPLEWRSELLSAWVYGVSCLFYVLPILFWSNPELMREKIPLLNHLVVPIPESKNGLKGIIRRAMIPMAMGVAELNPWYNPLWLNDQTDVEDVWYVDFAALVPFFWPLQAFLSFLSDYVTICLPSWSHALDTICACWGTYLFAYIFVFERMLDWTQWAILAVGTIHAYFSFSMSRYYRCRIPNIRQYIRWHTIWHCSLPLWTCVLGWYSFYYKEGSVAGRIEWQETPAHRRYPNAALTFVLPLMVGCTGVWLSSPTKGMRRGGRSVSSGMSAGMN